MTAMSGAVLARASSAAELPRLAPVTTATQVLAVNGKVMSWHPVAGVLPAQSAARG